MHNPLVIGNSRNLWGSRVLLATVPTAPAAYLKSKTPVSKATLIDVGRLGASVPIHVDIRFADPSLGNGDPILPFSDFAPAVAGNNVVLKLRVRRGTDSGGLSTTTVDEYSMAVGVNNGINDRIPFDIIVGENLGIEAELVGNTDPTSALWIEAIATIVDYPSRQNLIDGYNTTLHAVAIASAVSTTLAPRRFARRQLVIVNTSTNADLWVSFDSLAVVGTSTFMIARNGGTYHGPVGGYNGVVTGIWTDPAPNGFALVTEGIDR